MDRLWKELEKCVRIHSISNKTQLREILSQERKNIGANVTKNLVNSMRRRLYTVIKQNGNATKY